MNFNNIQRNIFDPPPILDLKNIPQDSSAITSDITAYNAPINFKAYIKDFFNIWHEEISLPILVVEGKCGNYKENLCFHPKGWYKSLIDNANIGDFLNINKKYIVTSNSSLRLLPTIAPSYHHPLEAGQGYPFDNLQENLLRIGEPLLVSHLSKDHKFAFVFTGSKSHGFVSILDIAYIDDESAANMQRSDFAMIINDGSKLYCKDILAASLDLGAIICIPNKDELLLPFRDTTGSLRLVSCSTDKDNYITQPLELNTKSVKSLIDKLIDKPYGWGGYLHNRDCAQLVKDYFSLFAMHLPSFSAEQIKMGEVISLENMDSCQKLAKICTLPAGRTILYTKGHIVIYMGIYHDIAIIFHARWGVALYDEHGLEFRYVIGKSVITSLEYGKELKGYNNLSNFLESVTKASIVI